MTHGHGRLQHHKEGTVLVLTRTSDPGAGGVRNIDMDGYGWPKRARDDRSFGGWNKYSSAYGTIKLLSLYTKKHATIDA